MIDGAPCPKCGVNSWTDCEHRKATGTKPAHVEYTDKREKISGGGRYNVKPTAGNGRNFKASKK